MGVPYRDKKVLTDNGEAEAVRGGKEEGSYRGMELGTELGKGVGFVVTSDMLEGGSSVGEILAPFLNILWLVKVGRNPLTYDEAFGQTRSNLADVMPKERVGELVDIVRRGLEDRVVSGNDLLTIYENTGALRGSAKDLEESSGLSAERRLHTSVEEVGAVVGREVRVPDAPTGARCDVVVSVEGSTVGVSEVVVNAIDSE